MTDCAVNNGRTPSYKLKAPKTSEVSSESFWNEWYKINFCLIIASSGSKLGHIKPECRIPSSVASLVVAVPESCSFRPAKSDTIVTGFEAVHQATARSAGAGAVWLHRKALRHAFPFHLVSTTLDYTGMCCLDGVTVCRVLAPQGTITLGIFAVKPFM